MRINSWPYFSNEELIIVKDILESGKVNYWQGEEGNLFEKEFSKYIGTNNSIAVSNGSVALSLAYEALKIGYGDEVITSPRTYIATSSSLVRLGAKPIFADVDINSGNITRKTIEPLITKKTKAISIVHIAGWPADMISICELAKEKGLLVIEDCAQAHGAKILSNGTFKSVGSFGDISTWSFCQDKIISTAGEGGMVSTNSKEFFEKIWSLKDHGKTINTVYKKNHKFGFKWLHDEFGNNFRMTEIQSAIGRYQLKKLKEWNKKRTKNAMILYQILKQNNLLRIPIPNDNFVHAWYKFYAYINNSYLKEGWDRDRIIYEINQKNLPAFHGGCSEIYLEKCFMKAGLNPKDRLKNAKELGEKSIMFLVHPTIDEHNMELYAEQVSIILKKATK